MSAAHLGSPERGNEDLRGLDPVALISQQFVPRMRTWARAPQSSLALACALGYRLKRFRPFGPKALPHRVVEGRGIRSIGINVPMRAFAVDVGKPNPFCELACIGAEDGIDSVSPDSERP